MDKEKKKPGRPKGSGGSKHQWVDLKEKFIARHLSGDYITPEAFALEHKLNPRTVEYHALTDNWLRDAQARLGQQHAAVAVHSSKVLSAVRKTVEFDEAEIRGRHGNAMRGLINLALKKLIKIKDNPDELTVRDMIDIMKFAPLEERRAFGLPDTVVEVSHKVTSQALEEFERHIQQRGKAAIALAELTRIVEGEAKEIKEEDDGTDERGKG